MIRIAIIDDHEIFLKGVEKLLSNQGDICIVNSWMSGISFLADLDKLKLDLILLDLQLPDIEAEELIKRIREIDNVTPVLYLTMMRGSRTLKKLQKYNIQGYILKNAPLELLYETILSVGEGNQYFQPEVFGKKEDVENNTVTTPKNRLSELLSPREYEILQLICEEHSSAAIGDKLFLSTGTVDTHRRNILVKLGVTNTVGLVKFAIQNGVLET